MPFGGTFWSTGWEDVKIPHLFPSPRLTTTGTDANWTWNTLDTNPASTCDLIQGPINLTGDSRKAPSENIGYFLGKQTTDATVRLRVNIANPAGAGHTAAPLASTVNLPSYGIVQRQNPFYKAPFYRLYDPSIDFWVRSNGGSGGLTYDLFHVQPVSFKGLVSEVVGALLMYAGVDAAMVNQDSFDAAYDEELVAGADNTTRPYVWVIPQQGEQIIDTIKRVTANWSHVLGWGLDGKIGLHAANTPVEDSPWTVVGHGSNFKKVEIGIDRSLITNRCHAMHGAFSKFWAEDGWTAPEPTFDAVWEPALKSDYLGEYIDLYEDSTSQDKFGVRTLGEKIRGVGESKDLRQFGGFAFGQLLFRNINIVTEGEDISVLAMPLVYLDTVKDAIMEIWTTNETVPRRLGRLTQDALGLDQDIGSILTMADPGSDSEDPVTYRVVGQDVDWNSMTVVSHLVEMFQTRHDDCDTVIWDDVNHADAPVGSTTLSYSAPNSQLVLFFSDPGTLPDWHWQVIVSKDGGPWEELSSGWEAETGWLSETYYWAGVTNTVDVLIRAADDDGSGNPLLPTPWVRMPTASL